MNAPRPAWGMPVWLVDCAGPGEAALPCAGCGGQYYELHVCPGCDAAVCSVDCARRVHAGSVSCAWYDRPAYPGEPASYDGTPWPCDGCGGELPPVAYDPVARGADGMTWHACGLSCRATVTARLEEPR